MDNETVADTFNLLSKLMELHGAQVFKTRSYANAGFQIKRLSQPLSRMSEAEINDIPGVGAAIGTKIQTLLDTGQLPLLDTYLSQTPPGIRDMLGIKGLGPKKIALVWKEMEIEDLGALLYACHENRLMLYKGFGAKTQESIRQSIEFFMASTGQFLFRDLEAYTGDLLAHWKNVLGDHTLVSVTGAARRQADILTGISLVIGCPPELVASRLPPNHVVDTVNGPEVILSGPRKATVKLICSAPEHFFTALFRTTGSQSFLQAFEERYPGLLEQPHDSEAAIFQKAGLPFIPPVLRQDASALERNPEAIPLIQPEDIKGVIHAHSTWSDGKNPLEEMALGALALGREYLVISDHSQSAVYAGGLKPERILAQHEEIDALNRRLAPFRIFKSIESDILGDGSLDYPPELLRLFDLVIASVHSNLKMDESRATERLLTAIRNPFTTILGHMTGRLLLSRPGYPVDHRRIIEACREHQVVIEINAHPRRLDMDWSWIPFAMEQGVLLSVDPDAHSVEGISSTRYGVLSAQKGGLTAAANLSSFPLGAFEAFILETKKKIPA